MRLKILKMLVDDLLLYDGNDEKHVVFYDLNGNIIENICAIGVEDETR